MAGTESSRHISDNGNMAAQNRGYLAGITTIFPPQIRYIHHVRHKTAIILMVGFWRKEPEYGKITGLKFYHLFQSSCREHGGNGKIPAIFPP